MERYRPCLPALVELLSKLVAAAGPGHDQKAEDAATALLDRMISAIQQGMRRTAESIWSRCGAALSVFEPGLSFADVEARAGRSKDLTRPDGPRRREA
jgi:hypothetical protein